MTHEELLELVRHYLRAELEAQTPPCMHRYRGIVREREVARRWRECSKLRAELEVRSPWKQDNLKPLILGRREVSPSGPWC